jgi:hypothetical protein
VFPSVHRDQVTRLSGFGRLATPRTALSGPLDICLIIKYLHIKVHREMSKDRRISPNSSTPLTAQYFETGKVFATIERNAK